MPITDGFDLISNHAYAEKGVPHDLWTRLRAESPVHRCAADRLRALLGDHQARRHLRDLEAARQVLVGARHRRAPREPRKPSCARVNQGFGAMRVIIEMDPPGASRLPQGRQPRLHAAGGEGPRRRLIDTSARELVDKLAGETGEGECDFANDVAAAHPLRILSTILGVPRESEPDILLLTNQLFAFDDPDLQRAGEDRQQAIFELGLELYQLFDKIIQDRRADPRDDLASLLANGTIDGEPMGMMETVGYYLITFSAGHDTTKNALVGGMRALLENPEQFEKLKRHPELVESAVEEIVRWTSPVNYMKRTADRGLRASRAADRRPATAW